MGIWIQSYYWKRFTMHFVNIYVTLIKILLIFSPWVNVVDILFTNDSFQKQCYLMLRRLDLCILTLHLCNSLYISVYSLYISVYSLYRKHFCILTLHFCILTLHFCLYTHFTFLSVYSLYISVYSLYISAYFIHKTASILSHLSLKWVLCLMGRRPTQ